MTALLVLLSALLVIIADALTKEFSLNGSFTAAFFNPWMLAVYGLYFIQILLAIVIFNHKGELAIYANLYVVFYALLGIIFGVVFFKESLSMYQIVGAMLAMAAAILLSVK